MPIRQQDRLLIATRNRGKLREIRVFLADLPLEVFGMDEAESDAELSDATANGGGRGRLEFPEVEEVGATYTENALLKARSAARVAGLPALADDSGLEVDALDGAPGIHSARFAGPEATDIDNNRLLLARLAGVPEERRGARFVCTAALVLPDGREVVTEGVVEGRIIEAPRGPGGFGYDPLFFYEPFGITFGEAEAAAKNRVSHRARAFRAMACEVLGLIESDAG
jgi:XTP/dITP diphosphohydrolase